MALYSRFADRDAVMRFRGGGVGHKSTREATDRFLQDRDVLDLRDDEHPEMETHSDSDDNNDDKEGNSSAGGDENQEEWTDEDDEEEGDYGYGGLSAEESGEETNGSDSDSPDSEADDELGPEDGEGVENEVELLGYSNL
jgi:hypothetical protein